MTETVDLNKLNEKLNTMLDIIVDRLDKIENKSPSTNPSPVNSELKAYEIPELSVNEVIADGKTINRDGSIWATSQGESGPKGTKFGVCYGYISEKKNPELWRKLKEIMGEDAFERWNKNRDPYSLYKADLRPLVFSGSANMINVSFLLNSFGKHVQ